MLRWGVLRHVILDLGIYSAIGYPDIWVAIDITNLYASFLTYIFHFTFFVHLHFVFLILCTLIFARVFLCKTFSLNLNSSMYELPTPGGFYLV